jgi:hypothetical protein
MTNFVFLFLFSESGPIFVKKKWAHFSLKILNVVQKMVQNLPTKWLHFLFVYWTCVFTKQSFFSTKNLGISSVNLKTFANFLQFFLISQLIF